MQDYDRDFMKPGRSVSVSDRGMAATSHPLASLTAVDILRAGGNAIDAALAAVALQCVIDPHMTGIGGDCFAMVSPGGGRPVSLNGSGPAPAGINADKLQALGWSAIPDDSVHAVTVPGAVGAWCELHDEYGRLAMDEILAPAIAAAEEGFCITPRVAHDWAAYGHRLAAHAPAAQQFLPGGKMPAIGDRFRNPALAATLRRIAAGGAAAFYEGAVAEEIVEVLQALGGAHRASDFAGYSAFATEPISASYRGYELLECPPNGQGLAALMIMRILDGFDHGDASLGEADRIHLLAEATKCAYAQRDLLIGDPEHMQDAIEDILSERSIARIRDKISMHTASQPQVWDGPLHRDTVYVTVVDEDRNAISLINSLFNAFGSGIYAPKSGVLLQNRGSGFSLAEGHPNRIAGGKRPFHTIIPAMLMRDDKVVMSFGVMGGQYQAVGHAQILTGIIDRGLNPQLACEAPRSFSFDGTLSLETTIAEDVRRDLEARGHATAWASAPHGSCQAIWIDHDRDILIGATDHRKDGIALGY